jgi:hypothetical protein
LTLKKLEVKFESTPLPKSKLPEPFKEANALLKKPFGIASNLLVK